MKKITLLSIATLLGSASVSLEAQAQYTCTSGTCYYWANTGTGNAISGSATSGTGLTGTGTVYGVEATASGTSSYGLYATATGTGSVGIYGQSPVLGVDGYATGADGTGVEGTGELYGVYGSATMTSGYGVYGINTTGTGGGDGVYGESAEDTCGWAAGYFTATSTGTCANGVAGIVAGDGTGVYARTIGGYGVYTIDQGSGSTGYGLYATSTNGTGAYASGVKYGLYAQADDTGVYGGSSGTGGVGVWGSCSGSSCYAGYFSGNVYTTGTYGSSDIRLKRNVKPLADGMAELLQLKGVTFEWNDPEAHGGQTGTQRGFIAQDVEKVFPGWISVDKNGFKTLNVQQIEALEVESIRTLKGENDELRARTKSLEERLNALENGRDPVKAGIGLTPGALGLIGLGLAGVFVVSRRRRDEKRA
jgi:Chaperone of endosialidase